MFQQTEDLDFINFTHWAFNTEQPVVVSSGAGPCCVIAVETMSCPLQRLGCDNMLDSPQQEDSCLQCGGNGQSCYRVKSSFTTPNPPHGNQEVQPAT